MVSDDKCINTIRCLCADIVQGPKSGHPGAPLGMAPIAHCLHSRYMNFDSADPQWVNRDRFVLSNGHGCSLLYALLHLEGFPYSMDDLKKFRKLGSKTPGHPERAAECPGVEVSTGPLGQGITQAVGIALAQEHLAANFNRPGFTLFDHFTYVFCGDGCLQEGISCEATSLAGHLGLGRLIVVYDDNQITIDGPTEYSFSDDTGRKMEAMGWHVVHVKDGNTSDLKEMAAAIEACQKVTDRPSMIVLKTIIGYGSKIQGTGTVHGTPLGDDDIKQLKTKLGLDPEAKYAISADVYDVYRKAAARGSAKAAAWRKSFGAYAKAHPKEHAELARMLAGKLPEGWRDVLPKTKPGENLPTRKCSQAVLNAIAPVIPNLVGGCADLAPSCLTKAKGLDDMKRGNFLGRYIRFGVREHAMCAIGNGISCYGPVLIPFVATFYNFIGYAWGAVRVGAFSHCGTIHIATHDSIGVGEDGPTHQPVELAALCRATPNLLLLRPADQSETSGAYAVALERRSTPTVLALSRQNCPGLEGTSVDSVALGAYRVWGSAPSDADIILVGTGSEVSVCIEAAKLLGAVKACVVSMPCWELFEEQTAAYRASILVPGKPILAVEAWNPTGWDRYSHYCVAVSTYGASGAAADCFKHFGITKENVAEKAKKLIAHFGGQPAPSKIALTL
eukprot:TRINITY_DN70316_c0_g1_i1.p1 TRINITY_DN70316_c0_g1~~TRINITY_DN70316_c0_g1_i1.p1  ORF type:complete len:674 (+),score=195.56 TRINITY_DN70316_c0_g1_i1:100-2121(+)